MKEVLLSIIIPAYNEERAIAQVLAKVFNSLESNEISAEIIVVDDASTDNTIAEVENFALINTAENMDIGTIVNKKLIAASYIYRFTLNAEISNVKCLTSSEAEVFEFIAKPGTRIIEKPVRELDFPSEAKLGGIIRGDQGFVASGNMQVQEGDKVVVFTVPSGMKKLEKFFK